MVKIIRAVYLEGCSEKSRDETGGKADNERKEVFFDI